MGAPFQLAAIAVRQANDAGFAARAPALTKTTRKAVKTA
jgi:hypothetical protein